MNNERPNTEERQQPNYTIQPMSFAVSLLFLGFPALVVFICFHAAMPALIRGGVTSFYAYFAALIAPLILMVVASLLAYREEGNWLALFCIS